MADDAGGNESPAPPRATSPKGRLREWMEADLAANPDQVSLPAMKARAIAHFVTDDTFVRALVSEAVELLFYVQAQKAVARTRGHHLVISGDRLFRMDAMDRTRFLARRDPSKWSRWMEHVSPGVQLNLLQMGRRELFLAAARRRNDGDRDYAIARLWEALAHRLQEGQSVGEEFTPEQIDALHLQLASVQAVYRRPGQAVAAADSDAAAG